MQKMRAAAAAVAATLVLAGCATVQTPSKQDPFERFNRTMFTVNDTVDTYALKPVATSYNKVVPQYVRERVSSVFSNLGDIYTGANNLLQGKITAGTEDVMRFAMNSTFGLGGLFDFASAAGLPKHEADFGMTMGHYGVPPGPYLVLPLFGPSTVRDAAGMLVDWQADPMIYLDPFWLRTTLYGVRIVSTRASLLGASELLASAALDKYSFVRNAYLQRREYLIHDGNPPPPTYQDESGVDTGPSDMGAAPAGGAAAVPGATPVPGPATAPGPAVAPGMAPAPAPAPGTTPEPAPGQAPAPGAGASAPQGASAASPAGASAPTVPGQPMPPSPRSYNVPHGPLR